MTAIFNGFVGRYFVDDIYGIVKGEAWNRADGRDVRFQDIQVIREENMETEEG